MKSQGPGAFPRWVRRGTETSPCRRRLRKDLGAIRRLRCAAYFLTNRDAAHEAHRRGIPTVGHGSAANSFAARALGITEVDPLKLDQRFERFPLLLKEIETLGFLADRHPLSIFRDAIEGHRRAGFDFIPARDLEAHVGRRVNLAGWPLAQKRCETKKGEPMGFLTLEDETAVYETTLFPAAWRTCGHFLRHNGPVLVRGRVEEEAAWPPSRGIGCNKSHAKECCPEKSEMSACFYLKNSNCLAK